MKIYDISQELFSCVVFPGDPAPQKEVLYEMTKGDIINLTAFSMCSHNGTHIDAPSHFIKDGATVDQVPLDKTVGWAYVYEFNGVLGADDAKKVIDTAKSVNPESWKRLLLKGDVTVSEQAASVFADAGIYLVGNYSQTVGPENAPKAVHLILLGAEVVLLEGIRLGEVPEGEYILSCTPINLGGCEGAPCRAVLIKL